MNKNAYRGDRFPPAIIQVTVWMYARFTLSLRDAEELLAERGLDIPYETVRRWFLKFGQVYARQHPRWETSTDRPRLSRRDGDRDGKGEVRSLAGRQ